MSEGERLPLLGVVRVHTDFAKDYAIHARSLAPVEVRRVSSTGGYASPVGVVTGIDTGFPRWDHSGAVYVLAGEEQEAAVAADRELAGEVDG